MPAIADIGSGDGDAVVEFDHLDLQPGRVYALHVDGELVGQRLAGLGDTFVLVEETLGAALWNELADRPTDNFDGLAAEQPSADAIHISDAEIDNLAGLVADAFEDEEAVKAGFGGGEE